MIRRCSSRAACSLSISSPCSRSDLLRRQLQQAPERSSLRCAIFLPAWTRRSTSSKETGRRSSSALLTPRDLLELGVEPCSPGAPLVILDHFPAGSVMAAPLRESEARLAGREDAACSAGRLIVTVIVGGSGAVEASCGSCCVASRPKPSSVRLGLAGRDCRAPRDLWRCFRSVQRASLRRGALPKGLQVASKGSGLRGSGPVPCKGGRQLNFREPSDLLLSAAVGLLICAVGYGEMRWSAII
mmetsp:Transcript_63280/g.185619  ORF Transcript_63280/g.185619 Transcript_63280/m.185619 type:complete len:243 (+) Transcript_63280:488-1216(+)